MSRLKRSIAEPTEPWSWRSLSRRLLAERPWQGAPSRDEPEIKRVKFTGYLFALLASVPGLLLLLLELLNKHAYPYAMTHGSVLLGAAVLFVYVLRRPERLPQAEWLFAALLTLSAVAFLILYAQQPERILGHELLGSVLLFITAGLLLVLPPQTSIPLSIALLSVYGLEVWQLSGAPAHELRLSQWVSVGMLALLMVGVVMRQTLSQLTARLTVLEELSARDTLTGLLNRRGFNTRAAALRESGRGGVLIVLDIDDFKPVNDTHGHATGDLILTRLGDLLELEAQPGGVVARWGGEEFVVYLPEQGLAQGLARAERMRQAVQGSDLQPPVTVSLGVSFWAQGEELHHAFLHADRALYQAKAEGKNRVQQAQ